MLKPAGTIALGFTVNSGQPREGVAELLDAAGFAGTRIVDRPRLFLRDRVQARLARVTA